VASDHDTTTVLDRAGIEARIPHRDPFLFVDRVLELDAANIVSEWDVVPELPCFAGHFPSHPILPGVLINEFVFQSAALLMSEEVPDDMPLKGVPVLTRIEDARFKQMVRPGSVLRAEVTLEDRLGPACYMRARVTCEGRVVARQKFVVALASPEESA